MDIDISINMEPDNISRFIKVMEKLSLTPRAPIPAETLLDKDKINQIIKEKNALVFTFIDINHPFRQVDIFLTESHSYENLLPNSDTIKIQHHKIYVVSKKKLIELKKAIHPPRPKDLFDINELQKIITRT
jgi:hypothetical protein